MIIIVASLLIFFFTSLYIISYTNRKSLENELINVSNILFQKLDQTISEDEMKEEINEFTNNQRWFYVVVTNSYGYYVIDSSTDENLEINSQKLTDFELELSQKLNKKDRIYIDNQMMHYIYQLNDNIIIRTGFELAINIEYILLSIFYLLILIIIVFFINVMLSKKTSNRIIEAFAKVNTNLKLINQGEYQPIETSHRYLEVTEILEEINKNIYNHIIIHEQERKRISFIINNVKQGIIVIDENKKLMFINSYAKKVLKTKNEIVEDSVFIEHISDQRIIDACNKIFNNQIPIHLDFIDEEKNRIYDFRFSYCLSDWTTLNKPLGMVFIIINDVTEVREIDENRNDFISNASHELKTPITAISGFSELILNGLGDSDEIVKNYIDKIHKETIKMRNTINELLYLSNLDYRSASIILDEIVDLNNLIITTIYEYNDLAATKNITISYKAIGSGIIKGSEALIMHLINNLVDNAIKYNKENGAVDIRLIEEEKVVKMEIADTGIGISEANIKKVFDRFYRVEKSRNRETGGTGLGLAIAKKICMVHYAKISVTSKVNEGTTFKVIFNKYKGDGEDINENGNVTNSVS